MTKTLLTSLKTPWDTCFLVC